MTATNQDQQWDYVGDGVNATFFYDNVIYAAGDIDVFLAGVKKLLVTDYSVTGIGAAGGGSVVFVTPPAVVAVSLRSNIPETQGTAFPPGVAFNSQAVGTALDRLTRLVQQAQWAVARSIVLAESDAQVTPLGPLPPKAVRINGGAGSYLGFDGVNGDPTTLAAPIGTSLVSAAMAPVILAATVAAARGLLGSTATGDALFTAASALAARQTAQVPFSASRKPLASPYASVAGDVGFVISSESAGAPLVTNLLAGATYGIGAVLTFYKLTNQHTVNTNGAERINGGVLAASVVMTKDGDSFAIQWDGAQWKVIAASPNVWALLGAALPAVVGAVRNLKGVRTSATVLTYTADEVITESALGGNPARTASVNLALNGATVGAGGMDIGTQPTSGFLSVYLITGPGQTAKLLGTIASQTSIYGGANMPAGYTQSALIGIWPCAAGPSFPIGTQYDREFFWQTAVSIFSGTTGVAAMTSQSISAAVPAAAKNVSGTLSTAGTTTGGPQVAADAAGTGIQQSLFVNGVAGIFPTLSYRQLLITTAQTIFWNAQSAVTATWALNVTSFMF